MKEYNSHVAKRKYFNLEVIETEVEIDGLIKTLDEDTSSIWRGMRESKYGLYTSLQREWEQRALSPDKDVIFDYLKAIFQRSREWGNGCLEKLFRSYSIEMSPNA